MPLYLFPTHTYMHTTITQAEKYKSEDDKQAARVEAKNSFENYAYSMRNSLREETLASKLDAGEKAKAQAAVDAALSWLEANQLAETEEFEHQQRELEAVCNPIISHAYQGGANAGSAAGGAGPHVEEVD